MSEKRTELVASESLGALVRQEVDLQIRTAHEYGRNVRACQKQAQDLVCINPETAAACEYKLPRGNKDITGPSVRLAEAIANSWKNLRVATRVIDIGDKFLTCQGVAHDLESNVAVSVEVKRRITTKSGQRFGDDMIMVTANAAAAIAYRNVVFKIVPAAFWKPVYDAAKVTASNTSVSLEDRRNNAINYLKQNGILIKDVLAKFNVKAKSDLTAEHIDKIRGYCQAASDGDTTLEEIFKPKKAEPEPVESAADDEFNFKEVEKEPEDRKLLLEQWESAKKGVNQKELKRIYDAIGVKEINAESADEDIMDAIDMVDDRKEGAA